MTKLVLTLDTLRAVFGTDDQTPITITATKKSVAATRSDVTVSNPSTDIAGIEAGKSYTAILKADGTIVVEEVPKALTAKKQSPSFNWFG